MFTTVTQSKPNNMNTIRNLLMFAVILKPLAGSADQISVRYDKAQVKERLSVVAPKAKCTLTDAGIRVEYNTEQKSIYPRLKDGSSGKQLVVIEAPQLDGWLLDVAFRPGPYHAALYRPAMLNLAKPRPTNEPREEAPYFRTAMLYHAAVDEHVIVYARFGEKADLGLIKAVYQAVRALVQDLPKSSE